jgi:hypothetical protein
LSRNLGTLTSWNPLGHSRSVTGLLYLAFHKEVKKKKKSGVGGIKMCTHEGRYGNTMKYIQIK